MRNRYCNGPGPHTLRAASTCGIAIGAHEKQSDLAYGKAVPGLNIR
jgi:hypothetical protein